MTPSELQNKINEVLGHQCPTEATGMRVDKVRRIFSRLPDGMRVLDVGCSTGVLLKPFAKKHEIHGVDITEAFVKTANAAGFKAVQHDVESAPLPYPDKHFDVVFCGETIEHHVDTDWLVSEINRVLKPRAKLILTFPNIRTLLSVGMMFFLDLPPMYAARYRAVHFRDFTLRTMRIVLKNHKFELERAIGSAFFLPGIGEFGSFLSTHFPSWSSTVICIAVKTGDSAYLPEETFADRIF